MFNQRKEKWESVDGWGGWTLMMGAAFVRVSKQAQANYIKRCTAGFVSV